MAQEIKQKRKERRTIFNSLSRYRRRKQSEKGNKPNSNARTPRVRRLIIQNSPKNLYLTRRNHEQKLASEKLQNFTIPYVRLERIDNLISSNKERNSSIEDGKSTILQAPSISPKDSIHTNKSDLAKNGLLVSSDVPESSTMDCDIKAGLNSVPLPPIVSENVSELKRRRLCNPKGNQEITKLSSSVESQEEATVRNLRTRSRLSNSVRLMKKRNDEQKIELESNLNTERRQSITTSSTEFKEPKSKIKSTHSAHTAINVNIENIPDTVSKPVIQQRVKNRKTIKRKRAFARNTSNTSKSRKKRKLCTNVKIALTKLEIVNNNMHIAKWKQQTSKPGSSETSVQDAHINDRVNILSDSTEAKTVDDRPKENSSILRKSKVLKLYEDLRQKYNLFEEPKVLLIQLETLKETSHSEFSALEIEQLTKKYMNLLMNSNFLSHPRLRVPQIHKASSPINNISTPQSSHSTCAIIKELNLSDTESAEHEQSQYNATLRTSPTSTSPTSTVAVSPYSKKRRKKENLSASRNLLLSWLSISNKLVPTKGISEPHIESSSPQKSSHSASPEEIKTPEKNTCTSSAILATSPSEKSQGNQTPSKTKSQKERLPSTKCATERMIQLNEVNDYLPDEDIPTQNAGEHVLPQTENDGPFYSDTAISSDTGSKTAYQAKEACNKQTNTDKNAVEPNTNLFKRLGKISTADLIQRKPINMPTIKERFTYKSKRGKEQSMKSGKNIHSANSFDNAITQQKRIPELRTADETSNKDLISYKCVVCDMEFEQYSILQNHLTSHRKKQNTTSNSLLNNTANTLNELKEMTTETLSMLDKRNDVNTDISSSTVSKGNAENDDSPVSCARTNIICKSLTMNGKPKSCLIFKTQGKGSELSTNIDKLEQTFKELCTLNCSVCSKAFATKTDLAQHLYTHTERELQQAYESAKAKCSVTSESDKQKKTHKRSGKLASKKKESTAASSAKTDASAADESMQISTTQESVTVPEPTEQIENTVARSSNATPTSVDNDNVNNEVISHTNNAEAVNRLPNVEGNSACNDNDSKRLVRVCDCHKNEIVNKNCLKIEVVLLCQVCRILYRTMECFETHYRNPEYSHCKENRLHGRIPKLFCTKCALIFSSLQDLRHHLELHARYNKSIKTDFRCNICKVIFIGIGSVFYNHWSNHLKNAFFLASRFSFPKTAVVHRKNRKDLSSTEQYIEVAEYICQTCKTPFSTEGDLKKHQSSCKKLEAASKKHQAPFNTSESSEKSSGVNLTVASMTRNCTVNVPIMPVIGKTVTIEKPKQPTIQMICGLCNEVFFDKSILYKHTLEKHNQLVEPQYICISQTATKKIVICNICANVSDSMEDFNRHWVIHNVMKENYICTYCEKRYLSLETFLKHACEHKSEGKEDPPSCKVLYNETDYTCKNCNLNFQTQEALRTHAMKHWREYLVPAADPETSKKDKSPDNADTLNTLNSNEPPSKQPSRMKIDTNEGDQTPSDSVSVSSKGTEKSQLSDVNELDDMLRMSTPHSMYAEEICQAVPEERAESHASSSNSNASSTIKVSTVVNKITSFINNLTANPDNPQPSTSTEEVEIVQVTEEQPLLINLEKPAEENLVSALNNLASKDAGTILESSAESVEPMIPKEASPAKPKRGFLRVKNLAELMPQNNPFRCSDCNNTFTTSVELANHVVTHVSNAASAVETIAQDVPLNISNPPVKDSGTSVNPRKPITLMMNGTSGNAEKPVMPKFVIVPASKLKIKKLKQQTTSVKPASIKPMSQVKMGQLSAAAPQTSGNQQSSATTAYHKNLLVYGSVLRPNLATLREVRRKKPPGGAIVPPSGVVSADNRNIEDSTVIVENGNTVNNMDNAVNEIPPFSHNVLEKGTAPAKTYTRQCTNVSPFTSTPPLNIPVQKAPETVYTPPIPATGERMSSNTQDKHTCMICPNYTCNRLTDYLIHELSEDHVRRKGELLQQGTINNSLGAQYPHTYCNSSTGIMAEQPMNNLRNPSVINRPQVQQQLRCQPPANMQQPQAQQQHGQPQQQPQHFQQQHFYQVSYAEPVLCVDQPYVIEQPNWTVDPPAYNPNTNMIPNSSNACSTAVINNQYQMPAAESVNALPASTRNYNTMQNTNSLVCSHCPKNIRFFSKELLQYHINVNHNFICEICGQHLFNLNELNVHRIKHDLIWSANAFQNKQPQ